MSTERAVNGRGTRTDGGTGSAIRTVPALAALSAILSRFAGRFLRLGRTASLRQETRQTSFGCEKASAFLPSMQHLRERETNMGAFIRFQHRLRFSSGQTMTEYALILATIAVVLISLYNTSGTLIRTLVDQVDPLL
jgi:Flp pilus assembly pilin Flp